MIYHHFHYGLQILFYGTVVVGAPVKQQHPHWRGCALFFFSFKDGNLRTVPEFNTSCSRDLSTIVPACNLSATEVFTPDKVAPLGKQTRVCFKRIKLVSVKSPRNFSVWTSIRGSRDLSWNQKPLFFHKWPIWSLGSDGLIYYSHDSSGQAGHTLCVL